MPSAPTAANCSAGRQRRCWSRNTATSSARSAANGNATSTRPSVGWSTRTPENSGALTTDRLLELGRQVGLTSPQFQQKVTDGTYDNWVRQVTDQSSQQGVVQTPTVLVNGRQVDSGLTAQGLLTAVNAANPGGQ